MARIAGVDLPNNKHGEIGLTYIFGIGRSSARKILDTCGIDRTIKVGDWNDEQIAAIRTLINNEYKIEGELRLHENRFTGTRGPLISSSYEKVQYQERRYRVCECR